MIYRGFVFALRPTPDQERILAQYAGVCRLIWNLCLEQRRDHWRNYQRTEGCALNGVSQQRELTKLRAEVDFIRAVPSSPQSRVIIALDRAYRRAWQGMGRFPRPKKKGVNDAFSFTGRNVKVETISHKWARVWIPKLGWIKFRQSRPIEGDIREATISRTALGWQVSFGCRIERVVPNVSGVVGADRGVAVPVMLSDGTAYEQPSQLVIVDRAVRRAQRAASRRMRGSQRHARARRRVERLQARRARIRKHWAHEATTDITRRYGTVVVEALPTRNMTRRAHLSNVSQKRGLNRAILNVGWHQIEQMLAYKAATLIRVDPAYSSQTCASCGTVDSRSRESQASFVCTACGHRDNADRNAAAVILSRGSTPVLDVEGCGCAPVEASTIGNSRKPQFAEGMLISGDR